MSRVDVDADDEGRRGKSNGSWGGIRDVIAGERATWTRGGGVVSRMRVDRCRLWGGTRRDAAGRGGGMDRSWGYKTCFTQGMSHASFSQFSTSAKVTSATGTESEIC